ncbi:MAG TPA: orotidine-5'-phosphate decarboxylase [Thermoplasmata archaeon]|nr:orotidine-5'-phosphate decarboxylase [Thermoplasmata archaeon]
MVGNFLTRLDRIVRSRDSLLCVGLDPDPADIPASLGGPAESGRLTRFLDGILRATSPHAAAFKCQLGSYLAFGTNGLTQLQRLTQRIGPNHLKILDLKANDIPNTMRLVRDGAFGELGFDAVTVTPWLGWETLEPFAEDPEHGIFVVAHSTNPGAPDFQEIPTPRGPLWLAVVSEVGRMAKAHGNAGVVVGATYSELLRASRERLGEGVPILIPGVGAQGGRLSVSVREGVDANGRALLVNSSRSILFASSGPDWAEAAGAEARRLKEQINQLRSGFRKAG